MLTALSPAKINTFLHVHQLRDDGFHNLVTYFQLIDLCDELTFDVNDSGVVRVDNPTINVAEVDDLCYRAAKLLQPYADDTAGVSITVAKNIPDGGGLGGGSSNAATVLVVLNNLWGLGLSQKKLLQLGLQLGSDVPIFIYGNSTLASGRGEEFIPTELSNLLDNQTIIVVKPPVHVATGKIFQSQLLTKRGDTGKIRDLDIARLITCTDNDFTPVVYSLYPEIAHAAERLERVSPAHLTGTGACLYTVLDDVKKADTIIRTLDDCRVFVVKALRRSPLNEFK